MKKSFAVITSAVCAALIITSLTACVTTEATVNTYTVSFDTDGGSTIASQTVEEGGYATRPEEDPVKDGYLFGNWYADQTLETAFEFETTAITADTTIYASWVSADDALTATFYWNYDGAPDDGVYQTVYFESGERIGSLTDPVRDGYVFGGWYTEDGVQFSAATRYTSSMSFYASWQASYTFEAEYTQLTGLTDDYPDYADAIGNKLGYNFSGSANGTSLIKGDSAASNGYYVSGLYYRGAYLQYEIYNDSEATTGTLRLVLSCEYADITLTSSTFQITVNGTALTYSQISLGDGSDVTTNPGTRGGWVEIIIGSVDLQSGENVIRLTVNNSQTPAGDAGTVDAAAPMIDCIKIITSAELSMTQYGNGYFWND